MSKDPTETIPPSMAAIFEKRVCGGCKHFVEMSDAKNPLQKQTVCMHGPPSAFVVPTGPNSFGLAGGFPPMSAGQTCGCWTPKTN